jgi:hypothetical protein
LLTKPNMAPWRKLKSFCKSHERNVQVAGGFV